MTVSAPDTMNLYSLGLSESLYLYSFSLCMNLYGTGSTALINLKHFYFNSHIHSPCVCLDSATSPQSHSVCRFFAVKGILVETVHSEVRLCGMIGGHEGRLKREKVRLWKEKSVRWSEGRGDIKTVSIYHDNPILSDNILSEVPACVYELPFHTEWKTHTALKTHRTPMTFAFDLTGFSYKLACIHYFYSKS